MLPDPAPTVAAPPPAPRARRRTATRQELALVAITLVWGGTFLTVQHGLAWSGPVAFVAMRFGVAALALAAISARVLRGLTRRELAVGSAVGVTLVLGYGLQSVGLQSIPSTTSAFLTALYVPAVPLLQWAALRRRPGPGAWAGVALAFVGVLLLTGADLGGVRLGPGEVATLVGALAVAAEIVLIGRFAGTVDARRVAVVQLASCAVLAAVAWPFTGEGLPRPSWELLAIVVALGVATAVIQVTMNWAQRAVSPTRATVIYAGEPVWAAVFGRVAGERLAGTSLAGAALVLAAVLVSELTPRRREPADEPVPPVPAATVSAGDGSRQGTLARTAAGADGS